MSTAIKPAAKKRTSSFPATRLRAEAADEHLMAAMSADTPKVIVELLGYLGQRLLEAGTVVALAEGKTLRGRVHVTPDHIVQGIMDDPDLNEMFGSADFSLVLPQPKAKKAKKEDKDAKKDEPVPEPVAA